MEPEIVSALQNSIGQKENLFATIDFDNTCIVNDIGEAVFAYVCKEKLIKDFSLLSEAESNSDLYHQKVFNHYYDLLDSKGMIEAYLFCSQVLSMFSSDEVRDLVIATLEYQTEELGEEIVYGKTLPKGIRVREEVKEIVEWLESNDVKVWIVSASHEQIVKVAAKYLGFPENIIALRSEIIDGKFTKNFVEPYPIVEGKVSCIQKYIDADNQPLVAIGDSMNDYPMLKYSVTPMIVDNENALSKKAIEENWFILNR